MHVQIMEPGNDPWILSIVYGSPNPILRKVLWQSLNCNSMNLSHPLLVTLVEKTSNLGNSDSRRCADFNTWIAQHQLIDLGFIGPRFTWTRGLSSKNSKGARLDRALCNAGWKFKFEEATVTHLPKLNSDHNPLLVILDENSGPHAKTNFKFQAAWIPHPDLKKVIRSL